MKQLTPEEIQTLKERALKKAQPWNEKIRWERELVVDAQSFCAWQPTVLPQIATMTPGHWGDAQTSKVELGDKTFYVRTLPFVDKQANRSIQAMFGMPGILCPPPTYSIRRTSLNTYYSGVRGEVAFTDDVVIPILVDRVSKKTWMSLTPMEIMTQRAGIRKARGKVLIGGLGMGWFTRRVLERAQVEHVTVVELDRDVLEFFGEPLRQKFGDRLTLVRGDVYKQDAARYDSCLLDIWEDVNDMPYDRKFETLKASHPNVWGWGMKVRGN